MYNNVTKVVWTIPVIRVDFGRGIIKNQIVRGEQSVAVKNSSRNSVSAKDQKRKVVSYVKKK